jgi:hypothetical protein
MAAFCGAHSSVGISLRGNTTAAMQLQPSISICISGSRDAGERGGEALDAAARAKQEARELLQ